MGRRRRALLVVTLLVGSTGGPGGCTRSPPPRGLDDPDAAVLIPAIKSELRAGDPDLPALVSLLESDDPAVRMFSLEALRRLTGQTFGYVGYLDPAEQREALAAWQAAVGQSTAGPASPDLATRPPAPDDTSPATRPAPRPADASDPPVTRPWTDRPHDGGPTVGPFSE